MLQEKFRTSEKYLSKDQADTSRQTGTIVINLASKSLQDEAGFPELLISDKVPQKKDISRYSYANYKNNLLVNQSGNFNYLVNSASYFKFLQAGYMNNLLFSMDIHTCLQSR
jgi:hypothetical protein